MTAKKKKLRPKGEPAELQPLEDEIAHHVYELSPGFAVFLGLHDYDGRLPPVSRAETDRWAEEADRLLHRLSELSTDALDGVRQTDLLRLRLLLEGPLFDLREIREYDRNPMGYFGAVSLTSYLVRDYAPAAQRVAAIEQSLAATPSFLSDAESRLDPSIPEPLVRLAVSMAEGLPAHFREAEEFARKSSAALGDRVARHLGAAEMAVKDFAGRLNSDYLPRATQEFALGPEKFQRLLWVREGIQTPFAEILASGQKDLERNQRRLAELARQKVPSSAGGQTVETLLEKLYIDHPSAQNLIRETQAMVDEAKAFVRTKDLVSIPEPAVCRVEETPTYGRALFTASMNPPGPYDTQGDEGIYFVTPVDSKWTAEKQEEWLRSLNRTMLKNITVHEVYPGHYLQFLHFRKGARTTAQKVYFSPSFTEGWAHYCEQLAVEAGFGNGSADAEVAQLHDALLRDCRLIASVGLHTQGWSVDRATELFRKEAHFEELPARREAMRGTFNPEYFCYTLGKLAILDVRQKYLQSKFRGSQRKFHDRLLGFGAPPVGLLDRLMAAA